MGAPVRRRRRPRVESIPDDDNFTCALVDLVKNLAHGKSGTIHRPGCPANWNGRCDCRSVVIGPAIKDDWQ